MGQLGADSRTLDNQMGFIQLLSDATQEGLGAIVDADLAKESAVLQSLQVKQQLATQTLSIANSSPQVLLGLFRS
jgi:flagellin